MKTEKIAAQPQESSVHKDHRMRMRKRIEANGIKSLEEHEAMEYLLYFTIARGDTNPLAHRLIDRFGSFSAVLEASEEDLLAVPGVGPKTARFLTALHDIFQYDLWSSANHVHTLQTDDEACQYLISLFHGEKQEHVVLVAMNDKQRILHTYHYEKGLGTAVRVDIGKIVSDALAVGATAVILSHNHPGGAAFPSQEDMLTTKRVVQAFGVVGIVVLDHIIVADDDAISMRQSNRMPVFDVKTGEIIVHGSNPRRSW